jgi:hypothetical protein
LSPLDPDFTIHTKFQVCDYDGNWKYLVWTHYGRAWAVRDPATAHVYTTNADLNGNNLFKVDPPVINYQCWPSSVSGECRWAI